MYTRVGKQRSLGLFFCQNDLPSYERIVLVKGKLAKIHYDSALRPQRSCFANPVVDTYSQLSYQKAFKLVKR